MDIKLVVVNGAHAGKEIPVRRSRFVIGRSKECQLRPGCNLVSRRHCAVLLADGKALVEDLGSTNGTLLNGDRIKEPRELKHGDILGVGTLELEVRSAEAAAEETDSGLSGVHETVSTSFPSTPTRATVAEDKKTQRRHDEDPSGLDITSWLDDEISGGGMGSSAGDLNDLFNDNVPDTDTIPSSDVGKSKKSPKTRTIDPPQSSAKPSANGVRPSANGTKPPATRAGAAPNNSRSAASDAIDKLSRFMAKKK